jgi:acyl-CoA thioesterase II
MSMPAVLRLTNLTPERFEAPHPTDGAVRDVVFGGQMLAQAIIACSLVDPAKEVKSIHAVFARGASFAEPLHYDVDRMHSGRVFGSDTVTVWQGDRLCARLLVLLHTDEPDLIRHAIPMPLVDGPDEATPGEHDLVFPGAEHRLVGGVDTWDPDLPPGPPEVNVWLRYPDADDDVIVNQAILAWATDGFLIGAAMRPHAGLGQTQAHRTISTGVVGHTVHFHERFTTGDWLLLAHQSIYAGRGRVHGRAAVFGRDGRLVATYTQDAIVRAFSDGRSHADDYRTIF